MRIGFLVFNLDGMGGTSRSAITQANALAEHHDVTMLSVTRSADAPHYAIDPAISVRYLLDVRDDAHPALLVGAEDAALQPAQAKALHARESALVPARWDRQFTALCDVGLEAVLPTLDLDVLVTVTPGLLACAVQLTPDPVVVVHQEHRSSNDRTSGLEPLLAYAPRADVVALLTPVIESWLHDQLGALAPQTVVVPNPLPLGFAPRATLDDPIIMSAGRLVPEKQFPKLVDAFGQIAHSIPQWRLRICGEGPQRLELVRQIRKWDLWDRVELPGAVPDMTAMWPQASVVALTSRAEGFPLVVQEAMAAGVPVVSFDCPSGPREIIDHEANGLLVGPQSVTGMAAALLRITTDDELRHRLGRGALHTARGFDAHALAERWTQIFADARARRGGLDRLTARAQTPPRRPAPDPAAALDVSDVTPAQARHRALSAAARAAQATSAPWVVMPAHEHDAPTVVLPMTARAGFLDALATLADAGDLSPYLSLRDPAENGWHERRAPVAELAAALRRGMTSVLHLEPWPRIGGRPSPVGERCGVEVQFWETAPDGTLIAPRRNPYTDRIDPDLLARDVVEAELDGVTVPSLPLFLAPTVTECRFPVDVVYTWVDGSDETWDEARRARLAAITGTAQRRESSGRARFLDRGELRYSMRSLHLFAPWVRRIHLVTAGQRPAWLDVDHPMINLVDHRDILPADALPTFNSHAIETALHRIEGLAEHFVYLNDDFLFGRPVRPESFFTPAGLTSVFLSPQNIGLADDPEAAPFLKAAWNNRRLLQEAFGAVITSNLAHAPYAHRRSVLEKLDAHFPDALAATARAAFRSDTDVSTLSSLAQHFGLLTGTAVVGDLTASGLGYVNISNADVEWQLNRLLAREQDFICLGDHHDHALRTEKLDQVLHDFFTTYFPVAAPWERT
ncbi:stealth conserved region 3 domain-containing protein [Nocardioides sp. R-C-SC26]|uniref:stealth conserved region 3 domain-containing protein n=1 Tax=Nocardioides sp. R-C-SC26 TaxID=2870414 RepID=UPI001E48D7A2|nr:stealth conserved region 3 domain-containing protein [Nocardioides sp. R-C-SC26]